MPKIICKGAHNKGFGADAITTGMQIGGKKMPERRELINKERKILIVMFKNMYEVINLCGGNLDIHGESFGVNDLFCLADKLGVVKEYDE